MVASPIVRNVHLVRYVAIRQTLTVFDLVVFTVVTPHRHFLAMISGSGDELDHSQRESNGGLRRHFRGTVDERLFGGAVLCGWGDAVKILMSIGLIRRRDFDNGSHWVFPKADILRNLVTAHEMLHTAWLGENIEPSGKSPCHSETEAS